MLSKLTTKLKEDVLSICHLIKKEGALAYLVGGSIRDAFLGEEVFDADIEVYGMPAEKLAKVLASYHKVDLVGKSYAVFKMQRLNIDVSTPRIEVKHKAGHKGFIVESKPNLSTKQAASRRDFTINSLLYDPLTDKLIDHFDGLKDLKNKTLKHVSEKFSEDPLRPLRAMQFIARFGFKADDSTVKICQSLKQDELATERIFSEWKKMIIKGVYISQGLDFLSDIGWLKYYPELQALQNCPQDERWHPEGDVWQHTALCMDAFAAHRSDLAKDNFEEEALIIGLAVLTHDFGKPATTFFEKDSIRSPRHELVGVPLAKQFLSRLTNQQNIIEDCLPLVRHHMQPYALFKAQSKESAIRRLSAKVLRLDRLLVLCQADYLGCGARSFNDKSPHLKWLLDKANELDIAKKPPSAIVMGRHLMELNVKPGIIYKTLLGECYKAQLSGEFKDLAGGISFLKKLLTAK
ncbi:MAG: HD domain-containing protein [SAR324 cluster bacterium]|nr:HD domain-containing protein [SAR324 cluster bacterium]